MFFAADYPFLNIFWSMIIFFAWVIWIWMVIVILADMFSRRDIGGWYKAAWAVFVIVVPFLAVLDLPDRPQRRHGGPQAAGRAGPRSEFDDYVKNVAAPSGPAAEIEKAKKLLDSGAIDQSEFDALKAKALA